MVLVKSRSWLWPSAALLGLCALAACQDRVEETQSAPSAPPAFEAVEATASKAPASVATPTPKTQPTTTRTVRSPVETSPVEEIPFKGKKIALVHTANVIGELEPCG